MIKTKFDGKVAELGDTVVTVTSGGLTTWIELFPKEKEVGPARIFLAELIVGDTEDLLAWARKIVADIRAGSFKESQKRLYENEN